MQWVLLSAALLGAAAVGRWLHDDGAPSSHSSSSPALKQDQFVPPSSPLSARDWPRVERAIAEAITSISHPSFRAEALPGSPDIYPVPSTAIEAPLVEQLRALADWLNAQDYVVDVRFPIFGAEDVQAGGCDASLLE